MPPAQNFPSSHAHPHHALPGGPAGYPGGPHEPEGLTLIGPGTSIKGEITLSAPARILGEVEGRITSSGRVEIGAGALCKATIEAASVLIDGTVHGSVLARERLELSPTAVIKGDVVAARLVAAEGSTLCGHCSVGEEATRASSVPQPLRAAMPAGVATAPPASGQPATSEVSVKATARPSASDLEGALVGLESKLAGFARARGHADRVNTGS